MDSGGIFRRVMTDGSWNLSGAIKWIRNNGKYQRILDLGRV